MGKKVKKGFVPALHLFMGLIAMILVLLIIMQLMGLLNTDLKKSIDSTAALTFAVSCSADKDNSIDISWTDMYYTPRSISCDASQCCPTGKVNGANPFGETSVRCKNVGTDVVPNYVCDVKNFQLPQIVKTAGNAQAWTDPKFWISGVGAPKFLVYYESFPQEEMAPFLNDRDDLLVPYMIIGGAMNAIPWGPVGGKLAKPMSRVFDKVGLKWISKKLEGYAAKKTLESLQKVVVQGDTGFDDATREILKNVDIGDLSDIIEDVGGTITREQAEQAAKAITSLSFKEAAVRSSIATSGRLATKKFFTDIERKFADDLGVDDEIAQKLTYEVTEKVTSFSEKLTPTQARELAQQAIANLDDASRSSIGSVDEAVERLSSSIAKADQDGLLVDQINREVASELGERGVRVRMEEGAKEIFDNYIKGSFRTADDAARKGFEKAKVKTGIQTMLQKAKSLLSSPEFMQGDGMKRAKEIALTLAKSKSVQYLVAEDFEEGFFNNLDSDYAPYADAASDFAQCTAIVGFGKTKSMVCAGLLAAGMLQQTVENYNLPQASVGINTIALKPPFLNPYEFQLDKDAIHKYVALKKTDLFNADSHARLALASPCKGDLKTDPREIRCAISRCEALEQAKRDVCEGEKWEAGYDNFDECKTAEGEQRCREEKWKGSFKSKDLCKAHIELNKLTYCGKVPDSLSGYAGTLTQPKWFTSYKYGEETIKADFPAAVSGLSPIELDGPLDKDAEGYKDCQMPPDALGTISGGIFSGINCFGEAITETFSSDGFNGCEPRDPLIIETPSVAVSTIEESIKDDGNGNYCTSAIDGTDATALGLIHGSSFVISIAAPAIASGALTVFTGGAGAIATPLIASGINFAMGAATVWLEEEFVTPNWPKR